jgi:methyl-accepting chemotaxis protein
MLGPTSDAIRKIRSATADYLDGISASQAQAREMTNTMIKNHLTLMLAASLICITVISIVSWRIIKGTIGRLKQVVDDIEESSSIVSQASDKISHSSHSLSDDVAAQAASLEETSASLDEMDSTTRQNADNVAKATDTMNTAFTLVDSGAETVKHNISAMTEISESAGQIGNIIKIIEDIAFQTNLLALNASVEAARAGEAGKGFAVVADEVRNLAQRSSQAARDTSGLIRKTVERVQAGSENVGNLSRSFAEIEQAVGNMKRLIVEISSATNEQAQEVSQVSKAVTEIDKNTQGTASEAETLSSASMELMRQADQLNTVVKVVHELVTEKGARALYAQ